ncbi:MAG: sigma-70 family RNA polymerase sigma factor, partial [SAR324 cluster bacterium]|nr:sigma-70 family RNA polymerase sigma factor [SAR324 cluster bacterium]
LRDHLTSSGQAIPYAEVSAELNMTEGAVKVAMYRLRRRYRDILRDEIAQTVAGEDDVEEEIRDLFAALVD